MLDIQHVCDALDGQLNLELIDGCFSVVRGADVLSSMCCFKGMISPIDSYKRWDEVIPSHSTALVFDNKFDKNPNDTVIMQSRGFFIYMSYPGLNDAGVEVEDEDMNVVARMTNNDGETFDIPYYLFYTLLSNPVTTDITKLINKLEIVNPNDFYVTATILVPLVHKDGVGIHSDIIPNGC